MLRIAVFSQDYMRFDYPSSVLICIMENPRGEIYKRLVIAKPVSVLPRSFAVLLMQILIIN